MIVGIAGGEYGIRGFIDAYDAKSGKQLWRFWTVPAAGEPGSETWSGDSWKTGGAPAWVTGAYDPDLNVLVLGHRQSRAGLEPRRPRGRQLVLVLHGRA